jgi:hypothetical protein
VGSNGAGVRPHHRQPEAAAATAGEAYAETAAATADRQDTNMTETPVHDWLRPRLAELVQQAEGAGFDRDTVIAVLSDLIDSPPFNQTEPAP